MSDVDFSNGEEKIVLTPDEVKQVIVNSFGWNDNVGVIEKINIHDGNRYMCYYLIDHNGKNDIKVRVTEDDLIDAFDEYAESCGYEFINFNYIGNVARKGRLINDNAAKYEGVELIVKKRGKRLVRD